MRRWHGCIDRKKRHFLSHWLFKSCLCCEFLPFADRMTAAIDQLQEENVSTNDWVWSRACARAVHFLRVAELTWIPPAVRWPCARAWTECPSPGGERCVSSRCCTVARRRQQVKGGTSSFKCQSKVLSAWFNQQVSAVSASSTSRGLTSPKDSYESVCKGKNKKWIKKFNSNPVIVNPEKCKCALCRHALIWEGKTQHEASQKVLWFSRVSAEERFSFLSCFFFQSVWLRWRIHFICTSSPLPVQRKVLRLQQGSGETRKNPASSLE